MSTAKRTSPLTTAATLALTATTLATTLTFCRVFPDWSFLGPFVVIAASMHAVMAATRWQRRGIVATTLLAGSVLAVLLGISQSALSHQLRLLRDRDVVARTKRGRMVYYRLADDHIRHVFTDGLRHAGESAAERTGAA